MQKDCSDTLMLLRLWYEMLVCRFCNATELLARGLADATADYSLSLSIGFYMFLCCATCLL